MSQSVTALASEADDQRPSALDFSLCAPAQPFSKELPTFRPHWALAAPLTPFVLRFLE